MVKNKKRDGLLLLILAIIIFPLLTNFGSIFLESTYNYLLITFFNDNQVYLLLAWIVLTIILISLYNKISNRLSENSIETIGRERINLIEGLKKRYEKRLRKKMDDEVNLKFEIKPEYTIEGTSDAFVNEYYIDDYNQKVFKTTDCLFEEFETNIKKLLILGDPGSGKTVLLLEFALYLLSKAADDKKYPLPIILNLSTWRNDDANFETWLEQNLVFAAGEYGTTKKYAKELVQQNNMVLLLDGFDEVPVEHRNSCLERLQVYLIKLENTQPEFQYPTVIISSRRDEYNQIMANAPVRGTVIIRPLSPAYIISILETKKQNSSCKLLLLRVQQYPEILQELNTAFGVHMALHLVHNSDFKIFTFQNLLKQYIDLELQKLKMNTAKVSWYLCLLASYLNFNKKAQTFELKDIQSAFLKSKKRFSRLKKIIAFLCGSIVVFEFEFFFNEFNCGYLFLGGFLGYVVYEYNISFTVRKLLINTKEIREFKPTKKNLVNCFLAVLMVPFFALAALKVVSGTNVWLTELNQWIDNLSIPTVIKDFLGGAVFGFHGPLIVVAASVIFYLVKYVFDQLFTIKTLPKVKSSYYRFLSSSLFEFVTTYLAFFCMLSFMETYYLKIDFSQHLSNFEIAMAYLIASLLLTLPVTLFNSPLIQHLLLRILVYLEGTVPLRYNTFLNKVSTTGLMEKDGGQWRFRHRLIQDYFALLSFPEKDVSFIKYKENGLFTPDYMKKLDDTMILFIAAKSEVYGKLILQRLKYKNSDEFEEYITNLKNERKLEIGNLPLSGKISDFDECFGILCSLDKRYEANMLVRKVFQQDYVAASAYIDDVIQKLKIDMTLETNRLANENAKEKTQLKIRILASFILLLLSLFLYYINIKFPTIADEGGYLNHALTWSSNYISKNFGSENNLHRYVSILVWAYVLKTIVSTIITIAGSDKFKFGLTSEYFELRSIFVLICIAECTVFGLLFSFTPVWPFLVASFIIELPMFIIGSLIIED